MFFYLKEKNLIDGECYLSDTNEELINAYEVLKNYPQQLFELLKLHKNTEEDYYSFRKANVTDSIERASRFIYLNKTSYNGIYRVNKKGEYNVPYGHRKLKNLYDFDMLNKTSEALSNCHLLVMDFKEVSKNICDSDLVFFDPPYTVAHENNGFIHYNQSLFSWENQIELSNLLTIVKEKKSNFILTNAHHKSIEEVYSNKGKKIVLTRASTIGGIGASRQKYKELIYTNY